MESFSTPGVVDGWVLGQIQDQEMHIEDFYVSFLVRIGDVTERVLLKVNDDMAEAERAAAVAEELKAIKPSTWKSTPTQLRHEVNVLRQ